MQLLCGDDSGIIIQTFQTAGSHQSGHSPGSFKGSKTQEAGSTVKGNISGHKAETMTKENIETICQMIEDNNSLSINCIACEVGIDKKMFGSFSRRS